MNNIQKPTKKEFKIFDIFDKALWADITISEEIVLDKISNQLGISKNEIDKIYQKVFIYKLIKQ